MNEEVVDRFHEVVDGTIIVVGSPLLVVVFALILTGLEISVQYNARLAMTTPVVRTTGSVVRTAYDGYEREGAIVLGFAGAVTAFYILFSTWISSFTPTSPHSR